MADKHQAFVFESYPNKRQFPSLMGVFIKSTWLRGASSPHRPSSMRPTSLSAPGSDEDGNKNFQIHISSLSDIDVTPQVNLKHFFFFFVVNIRSCGSNRPMCKIHSAQVLHPRFVSRGRYGRFRSSVFELFCLLENSKSFTVSSRTLPFFFFFLFFCKSETFLNF